MPRANWKGNISFGLVSIPIILINSEDRSEKVSFHQIDKRNNARIKYERVNEITGKKVPWENIIKGYQYSKDVILPVDDDELQYVAGEEGRSIEIDNFVSRDSINFVNVAKTYYLVPDKKGDKGYVILREALKESAKIGIAKVIISTKEYVAAVDCYENALVLYLLNYPEEIKSLADFSIPSEDLKKSKVSAKEIQIAKQLIKSMSAKWQPAKYKNEYAKLVHQWAEKKIKNKVIRKPKNERKISTPNVVDFMDLLKQSLGQKTKTKTKAKKTAKA
jgi:DNA end-binding protein Ku